MTRRTSSSSAFNGSARRSRAEALGGAGALLFFVLVAMQNLLKLFTSPANDATPATLLTFAHDQAWTVHLMVVTYIIGFPALLLFAATVAVRAQRRNPEAAVWGWMGFASVVVVSVCFAFVNILQATLVAARGPLADDPTLTTLLWTLHNAVFTLNLVAVGGALLGLGWAAVLGGLISRRLGLVCAAGAGLLALSATPLVAEIHGSPLLAVGLAGFLCWLVFLVAAGVRLLRPASGAAAVERDGEVERGAPAPA